MGLLLRAFGESTELTIRERAELILDIHLEVSSILHNYEWTLLNRKMAVVDIRKKEESYPFVLSQVKQGLNAKVTKPTRYREDDTPDISSQCNFYEKENLKGIVVNYFLGHPSEHFHGSMFGIERINQYSVLSKVHLDQIVKLIISRFNPLFLSLVDTDFFRNYSKAFEVKIPWTGCFTYISKVVFNGEFPKTFRHEVVDQLGQIVYTAKQDINSFYEIDKDLALELEHFLIERKVKVKYKKAAPNNT